MKGGLKTGGKHEPTHSSDGGSSVDVTMSGAGYGTAMNPNTGKTSGPGGKGSSGKKSDSKPRG